MRLLLLLWFCTLGLNAQIQSMILATPTAASGSTCGTPGFSPGAGTYGSTQSVTITSSGGGGCTVCYNTTGSPTATVPGTCDGGSTTYTTPVSVASSETLYAIGTQLLFTNSSVASAVYTISSLPSFIQATSGDSSSASTISSATATTTTGNLLYATYGAEAQCTNTTFAANATLPTDTAGDTFTPIFPTGSARIAAIGATVTNGGSGYTTGATCSVSGAGGAGTCGVTVTANVVTAVGINTTSFWSGPVTITISPIGLGSGATAQVDFYGISNTSTECVGSWYAKNITGHSNNQVTMTNATQSFVGISVIEIAGASTSSPFDAAAAGETSGSTTVTSSSFASGSTGYFVACGTRVESLSQTWTAGSSYTVPAAATGPQAFMTSQYRANFNPNGTTASIVSAATTDRELICASFHN